MNKHFFKTLLIASVLTSAGCRSANVLWDLEPRIPKATAIRTGKKDVLLIEVKTFHTRPQVVAYSGLTLAEVCAQIAASYRKKYVKFISVDTRQVGVLGGGHTSNDIQLSSLLHILTSESAVYLHARKDTLIVEPNLTYQAPVTDSL